MFCDNKSNQDIDTVFRVIVTHGFPFYYVAGVIGNPPLKYFIHVFYRKDSVSFYNTQHWPDL